MSATTGEIKPVAGGLWDEPEIQQKDIPTVAPINRTGGGTGIKAGDSSPDNSGGSSFSDPGFSAEVSPQIQSFLKDNMGIELNFVKDGDGKTVVQVVDSNTGEVIRQIPPEKVALFRGKTEELRGILFNGQA